MTCGEVATALRLNLPLPIVVLDDRWLSLIQIKQTRRQFGIKGTALDIVEAEAPPAHYFGVPVIGVTGPSELESALEVAFAASGPTVIEARVDPAHYMDTVFD
jgi:acetolactate synthase-1/2/3 large subunit